MEILKLLISPIIVGLLVGIFMIVINRGQKKRDEKEDVHIRYHNMTTKGMFLLIDSNKLALESLKKLKDDKGKALLNGELTAINQKINEYKIDFETFIIEK